MDRASLDQIGRLQGSAVRSTRPLAGGCIAEVCLVTLENGSRLVAKRGRAADDLCIEAEMLRYLARHSALPVPGVLHAGRHLLLLQHCANDAPLSALAEADAGRHMAKLHNLTADSFGFERDTVIGPLAQPNPKSDLWIRFFRDHRLLYMAGLAHRSGHLPAVLLERLLLLADRLEDLLEEPAQPSLLHGDLWAGNVLCSGQRISAFIDPALYFGHAEMDLAYATLFASFGDGFFDAYQQHRPLQPGFFEGRRDLYNLYPLLVHVRLFGGSYVAQVETTLRQFGC
jgi:fructosamine-3-kinase